MQRQMLADVAAQDAMKEDSDSGNCRTVLRLQVQLGISLYVSLLCCLPSKYFTENAARTFLGPVSLGDATNERIGVLQMILSVKALATDDDDEEDEEEEEEIKEENGTVEDLSRVVRDGTFFTAPTNGLTKNDDV